MGDRNSTVVPATRRTTVRELAAGIVASIVAVTAYSWLTPATIRTGSVDGVAAMTSSSVTLPMVVVLLGSFSLGSMLWAIVVEHRRPWPFGPRGPFPNPFWRETIAAVLAFCFVSVIAGDVWDASWLYAGDDDRFVWVASPAAVAAGWVAALAVFSLTFILASAIAGRNVPKPTILPEATPAR
jgi:hypothetical protein